MTVQCMCFALSRARRPQPLSISLTCVHRLRPGLEHIQRRHRDVENDRQEGSQVDKKKNIIWKAGSRDQQVADWQTGELHGFVILQRRVPIVVGLSVPMVELRGN